MFRKFLIIIPITKETAAIPRLMDNISKNLFPNGCFLVFDKYNVKMNISIVAFINVNISA